MESADKRGHSALGSDVVVSYADGTTNCTRFERRTYVVHFSVWYPKLFLGTIRRLGDFSEDPPNPYDPLDIVDKNADAQTNGTFASTKEILNGSQKGESETQSVAQELSPLAIDVQSTNRYDTSSEITEEDASPKQDRASPSIDTGDRPKHSDNDVAKDVQAGSMTDKPISIEQQIHKHTHPPPPSDPAGRDQNGISPQLQEIEKHLNAVSLLAKDANQTARNALKAEVEQIKNMQSMHRQTSTVRRTVF